MGNPTYTTSNLNHSEVLTDSLEVIKEHRSLVQYLRLYFPEIYIDFKNNSKKLGSDNAGKGNHLNQRTDAGN